MTKRGEGRDPHSFKEFLKQDLAEEELFSIKDAEKQADYSLSNDSTLENLHIGIDKLIVEILKKQPSLKEQLLLYNKKTKY